MSTRAKKRSALNAVRKRSQQRLRGSRNESTRIAAAARLLRAWSAGSDAMDRAMTAELRRLLEG